jgi:hypothetical protein
MLFASKLLVQKVDRVSHLRTRAQWFFLFVAWTIIPHTNQVKTGLQVFRAEFTSFFAVENSLLVVCGFWVFPADRARTLAKVFLDGVLSVCPDLSTRECEHQAIVPSFADSVPVQLLPPVPFEVRRNQHIFM